MSETKDQWMQRMIECLGVDAEDIMEVCEMFFDGTDAESGIRAASNSLTGFEHHYYTKRIFVSVVYSKDYDTSSKMVNRALDILEYAYAHNMDNVVVDNSSMLKDY